MNSRCPVYEWRNVSFIANFSVCNFPNIYILHLNFFFTHLFLQTEYRTKLNYKKTRNRIGTVPDRFKMFCDILECFTYFESWWDAELLGVSPGFKHCEITTKIHFTRFTSITKCTCKGGYKWKDFSSLPVKQAQYWMGVKTRTSRSCVFNLVRA